MTTKTENLKQETFIHGPYNNCQNGFVLLYHSSSRVAPFFTNVQQKTAPSLSPSDIIHPHPDAPRNVPKVLVR